MEPLKGKRVILGISGGIAAYKCGQLIREFIKSGAEVKVVVTPSALRFITELTLSVLSRNQVLSDTFQTTNDGTWHISYAQWADVIVIAPATVNTIAKIAHGFADNALTTLIAARRSPVILCPAADEDMYMNPANTQNISSLKDAGFYILHAEKGELASGLSGIGRLPELYKIVQAAETVICGYSKDLQGKKILITAGPTFEDIDPVRFIGNRSSGKMGFALAKAAWLRGAEVTLISGPVSQRPYPEIKTVFVRSAREMQESVIEHIKDHEVLIMSAAVADFRPLQSSASKIKKSGGQASLQLTENPDILAGVSGSEVFKVGFALETDDEENNARQKLISKSLDLLVLNSLRNKNAGFEYDTNKVTIFDRLGEKVELPLLSKFQTAHRILDKIKSRRFNER